MALALSLPSTTASSASSTSYPSLNTRITYTLRPIRAFRASYSIFSLLPSRAPCCRYSSNAYFNEGTLSSTCLFASVGEKEVGSRRGKGRRDRRRVIKRRNLLLTSDDDEDNDDYDTNSVQQDFDENDQNDKNGYEEKRERSTIDDELLSDLQAFQQRSDLSLNSAQRLFAAGKEVRNVAARATLVESNDQFSNDGKGLMKSVGNIFSSLLVADFFLILILPWLILSNTIQARAPKYYLS